MPQTRVKDKQGKSAKRQARRHEIVDTSAKVFAVITWLGMHNYTYLSLRAGGHFSVKEVAKSFAYIFTLGIATRE